MACSVCGVKWMYCTHTAHISCYQGLQGAGYNRVQECFRCVFYSTDESEFAFMARAADNPTKEEGLLAACCATITLKDSIFHMTYVVPKIVTIQLTTDCATKQSTMSEPICIMWMIELEHLAQSPQEHDMPKHWNKREGTFKGKLQSHSWQGSWHFWNLFCWNWWQSDASKQFAICYLVLQGEGLLFFLQTEAVPYS